MFRQQPMPMGQNGLIGQTQQEASENVLNVGGGAPKQKLLGGIGSLGSDSISGQFGQVGSGQYGNASSKSLEQVLAERGFEMPKKPTGFQNSMQSMFKDPITGEYRSGGAHAAKHASSLTDFYGENPEALEIAKQYNTDPTQFGDEPPQIQTAEPESFPSALQPASLLKSMPTPVTPPPSAPLPTAAPLPPVTPLAASPMQQPQPQPPPSQMQPPPSPIQQPQYSQQDMQGMMGLMIQMFQKAMQNSGGQNNYNAGSFSGNNMQFQQPQYAPPSPQPMTGRQRFLKNSGNSPFGQY